MTDEERVQSREGAFWPRVVAVAVLLGVVALVAAALTNGSDRKIDVTLSQGTALVAALDRSVSTESSEVGDAVSLTAADPIRVNDSISLPAGTGLRGEVTHAKGGGRIAGSPELTIRFTRLVVDGEEYPIGAEPFRVRGKNDVGESALQIGGGAVVGGVVGAIAGDALKGAAIGAVLGTGVAVATKGDHIVLPAGQKIRVRLSDPVTVSYQPPVEQ